ncbi:MAG: biosynthetic-type acetolactate synthase large subunit [Spirochaetaceae bacterium]|jgi:acetolactate synthase-1/2/3 large subunit|nr:biosynthetic-type acetolactate synthase large subunit [Spirochaetaceae bacterium]
MQYSGARILIETLIEQGVDTVFGYPGGAVLNIYDELYRHRDRIRHILVSHEQHAAHAADGFARSTGRVGVCIATSGPGATNLVTGIAAAYMDSSPVVAITGNVSNALLGKDSFQEVDIAGITMPIVKHNWIVKDVRELAEVVREAFLVARSGRPGPVLVDIPKDVTSALADVSAASSPEGAERGRRLAERNARPSFDDGDIERALELIGAAKRPFIYAGGGVAISDAAGELAAFVERVDAPVGLSLMAQGCFPRAHRLWTGMIGMHGTVASNKAVQKADLLIAIGARFSDRVTSGVNTFAKNASTLHFDVDPAEINKNVRSAASVTGDIKKVLAAVLKGLPALEHGPWIEEVQGWKRESPRSHDVALHKKEGLHPRFIIEETAGALGADAIVVTDVGQHQMWTAQFYPFEKARRFITSGGLGAMGFGLGAALGAKAANPEKPVALFTGDGSFRMNCAELGTLVAYGLPLLIVVFNNGVLGMVRQWQNLFYGKRFSETTLDRPPDFVRLAAAYGVAGARADGAEGFLSALEAAKKELLAGRAYLIDALIDGDEMVYPMVPTGKPIEDQLL